MTFKTLKKRIGVGKFELIEIEDWLYFSKAVQTAQSQSGRMEECILRALEQMRKGVKGGYQSDTFTDTEEKAFFLCKSPYGADMERGLIGVREGEKVTLFFDFERQEGLL